MTDENADAEALLEEAKNQKRHETEPTVAAEDESTLVDAVADAYADVEDGDVTENLTIRDANLAALFAALNETDELGSVIEEAATALDRDAQGESKAEALRLLVRLALDDVAPEALDAGAEGYQQYRDSQEIEF